MIVYIPTIKLSNVSKEVKDSILAQGHEYSIYAREPHSGNKYENVWANRRNILLDARGEYIMMNDDDIVHLKKDNIRLMKAFMDINTHYGAAALCPEGNPNWTNAKKYHVTIQCVMIRAKALDRKDLKWKEGECDCKTLERNITKNKWEFGYIKELGRVKEADAHKH